MNRRASKVGWGLYDLANTIFSMNVISLYFPLMIASAHPRGDVWFAGSYSFSMALTALLSPVTGALGGRVGHKRVLFVSTVIAVAFTAALAFGRDLLTLLLLFVVANCAYQISIVAYNSLLPSVAAPEERGKTSGLGVALGYLGSFIGMLAVLPLIDAQRFERLHPLLQRLAEPLLLVALQPGQASRQNALVPTAILFALFSIPLFFLVRERREEGSAAAGGSLREAWRTFAAIRHDRNLLLFMTGTFLYMDAVHTTYIVMGTYGKLALGLGDGEIVRIMSVAIATAIGGSFVYGWVADRLAERTVLLIVIANWIAALSLAATAAGFKSFLLVAVVAGIGLGGVEVVGRVALLTLIDERDSGRFFGFFAFVGKASSIVGPQIWALTLLSLESVGTLRYRIAVSLLGLLTIAGGIVLSRVKFGNRRSRATLPAS